MISPDDFVNYLLTIGIDTVVGVPDSTFKGLISCFSHTNAITHIRAVNECEAAAIGAGHFLAHNKPALVYMQNSGFGKAVNPCTSLLSRDIYSIPSLFLVGWRGKPGESDEPQHAMMGRILVDLLKTMEIPFSVMTEKDWQKQLSEAKETALSQQMAVVVIIPKGLFEHYSPGGDKHDYGLLLREIALEIIIEHLPDSIRYVSTTGKTSRELFEIRERNNQGHGRDFLCVGSMGCASSIALGLALSRPENRFCIIDGDGGALMQLGTMATIGHYKPTNLLHIIIDNNAHESTGGQPTVSKSVDFGAVGSACGYPTVVSATTVEEIRSALNRMKEAGSLSLLVIKCKKGSRKDLGRPTTTPKENKKAFMKKLEVL
jgi:phosphonopyruvate decarboxylase